MQTKNKRINVTLDLRNVCQHSVWTNKSSKKGANAIYLILQGFFGQLFSLKLFFVPLISN